MFKDKIVLMVTYDLDQAEQMDYVIHINDDGTMNECLSSKEFFKRTDKELLLALKNEQEGDADGKNKSEGVPFNFDDESAEQAKGIIAEEDQDDGGNVDYGVIVDYFNFNEQKLGGKWGFFVIIGLHILINIATSSLSFYLAYTLSNFSGPTTTDGTKTQKDLTDHPHLGWNLTLIVVICLTTTCIGKITSSLIFMSINRNLHSKVVSSLINTNMEFFDLNPSGRILNRMSNDIAVNDQIVFNFLEMIDYIIKCMFSVTFIIWSSPITFIVVVIQMWYFWRLRKKVIVTTRDTFSLKQLLFSPIVSLIQDSLNG